MPPVLEDIEEAISLLKEAILAAISALWTVEELLTAEQPESPAE